MKTFLHTGCGQKNKKQTTQGFNTSDWEEVRLDIDSRVKPDIIGSITDMSEVETASMDGVFSSHNIEHLYPHEVPQALSEIARVLKPDGFLILTCPDLQSVCKLIAEDKLTDPAYHSPAGPIAPIDILYGHRPSVAQGNLHMAHRCGFTQKVLVSVLNSSGFQLTASIKRAHPHFDLWAAAVKRRVSEKDLKSLAAGHFPGK